MPIPFVVAAFMTAALTVTTAGGGMGAQATVAMKEDAATASRRITVAMEDDTFSPNSFDVSVGDSVTFVFSNFGRKVHDAFIGDKAAQEQHGKEMRETPGGHDHAHEGGVTVHPGETGHLRYVFDKPGTLEIGCHQPGHYEAGMIAVLNVNPV